VSTVTAH
jgi:integrase